MLFKNSNRVGDLADGLKTGEILPGDIAPIRLSQNSDGILFTFDI